MWFVVCTRNLQYVFKYIQYLSSVCIVVTYSNTKCNLAPHSEAALTVYYAAWCLDRLALVTHRLLHNICIGTATRDPDRHHSYRQPGNTQALQVHSCSSLSSYVLRLLVSSPHICRLRASVLFLLLFLHNDPKILWLMSPPGPRLQYPQ